MEEKKNGSTPQSEAIDTAAAADDWRANLPFEARQRIVDRITEILSRYLPVSVAVGFDELHKSAVRFEDKMYSAATSQDDYLKRISVKMLSMEAKSRQAPAGNTRVPNVSHVYRILRCPDHDSADLIGKLQNLNLESKIEEDQKH